MNRTRLTWLCIGILLGWLSEALWATRYNRHPTAPQLQVIAMPGATIERMCPVVPPRVWLPFRTPKRAHVVPQCGEPTISRNQADAASSGVVLTAPMARGSLPNSLAAHSGPLNLEEPPPGIWPVPFEDYPGASAPHDRRCDHDKDDPTSCKRRTVPEPSPLRLMAAGVALLGFWRRVA